jgi:hypothetical protein
VPKPSMPQKGHEEGHKRGETEAVETVEDAKLSQSFTEAFFFS